MKGELAKHKFEKGDKVHKTKLGIKRLATFRGQNSDDDGVVVGFGRGPNEVRILRKGKKYPETYHMDFWYPYSRPIE